MGLPNILTLSRLFIIPIFGYLLYVRSIIPAVILFIAAGITDVLDGYAARILNKVTSWGKIADPIADKLIVITALTILTLQNKIHYTIIIIIAVKELSMGLGGLLVFRKKRKVVSASWYGKIAAVIFYFAIILVILEIPYYNIIMIGALGAAIIAFFLYIIEYIKLQA